jgi:predicted amidohydrolase
MLPRPTPGFKLALIQMRIEPGRKERNLSHAAALASEAALNGAEVVVLPEAMPLGWMDASTAELADQIPTGLACVALREIAQRHKLYVCSGLVERAGERVFNAAVLIDPRGEILLHHRKLNELEIARAMYGRGDRLQVAPTPWGTFGLMICADAFASGQVISRTLGYLGARVILSPCAWAVPPDHDQQREPYGKLWRDNYGPVARDFQMWIAGASNVGPIQHGPWKGHKCIGCSLVVGPSGQPVAEGPYGEDAEHVLYVDVQPAP